MEPIKPERHCSKCTDTDLDFVLTPDKSHYGKWICSGCKKFVIWSKSPKTCKEMLYRQFLIRRMIESGKLDRQELHELLNMYTMPRLDISQKPKYSEIHKRFFREPMESMMDRNMSIEEKPERIESTSIERLEDGTYKATFDIPEGKHKRPLEIVLPEGMTKGAATFKVSMQNPEVSDTYASIDYLKQYALKVVPKE